MFFLVCVLLRIMGMVVLEVIDFWYFGSVNEEFGVFLWVFFYLVVKKIKFWDIFEDSLCRGCFFFFKFVCNVVLSRCEGLIEVNLWWRYVMCK